jgi:hypothetical protein
MVAGFTTTYAIDVYHHKSCEYGSRSWRCVFNTTMLPYYHEQIIGINYSILFLCYIYLHAFMAKYGIADGR